MKPCLIIALAFALASCGNTANGSSQQTAAEPPLKSFEFRGLKPGLTTVGQAQKLGLVENCTSYTLDKVRTTGCWATKHEVGDISTGASSIAFENGVFDWLSIEFSTELFERMVEQTRQVYGEPCQSGSKQLQNSFGAKFAGDEVRWCFAEGALTVRRHSQDNFRLGEFDYFTDKPEKPAGTYNAYTL